MKNSLINNATAKKVCLVTCYRDPEYVRVRTLEKSLSLQPKTECLIVRNRHRGLLRYIEVTAKLLRVRISNRPDIYLVTFRGYEILPLVLLIAGKKKVIFDEFINLIEWIAYEHKKFNPNSFLVRVVHFVYRLLLSRADLILTDTTSHADYSARLMDVPRSKYQVVAVGADEDTFKPTKDVKQPDGFQVFYYGSMLPLHGIEYVIEAAIGLSNHEDISFLLVGGGASLEEKIRQAVLKGANIEYRKWIPYEQLPIAIDQSMVCLGGPFGNTVQSRLVVTGKTCQFLSMQKLVIVGETEESNIFIDKVNSLVVKQADADALQTAILWAFNNQDKLASIGRKGRVLYQREYSQEAISQQLTDALDKVETNNV